MNMSLGCNTFDYFGIDESKVLLTLNGDGYQALIVEGRLPTMALPIRIDRGYTLAWTDHVANHWGEHYDSLAVALARLAVLQRAAEDDFQAGFRDDPDDFANTGAWRLFDNALDT